jgi:long-chain acyl-CoA synthetase
MPLLTDRLNFGNIFFRDKTYTPDTVNQNIDAVTECLNKRIISNSPFVYLFAPNHIKMVYALFGIIKSGRICVLVDPAIGKLELAEMMADTVPGALIRIDKTTDTFDFEKEFEFKDYMLEGKRLDGLEDVCLIVYTNASDGWAKGAMLTSENLLANAEAGIICNPNYENTVSCSVIPFHHLFALQTGVIIPSIARGNILIEDIADFSSTRKMGAEIERFKATYIYAAPLVYYFLKKLPNIKSIVSHAKNLTSGGSRLSESIYYSYKNDLDVEIQEGYGLTEASPICTWHWPGDKVKQGSVGRAFPCCEVAIFDPQDQSLPAGQVGEICIKGANVMKGYYNNPEATQLTLNNGWLHSGDMGKMDDEGYVYFIECKKRMVNVGGYKVYPAELERLMKIHSNVLKVTVLGESDELLNNVIRAHVALRDNTEEAKKEFQYWCAENISKYKLPQKIEFV